MPRGENTMTRKKFREKFVNTVSKKDTFKKMPYETKAQLICWVFVLVGIVWEIALCWFLLEFAIGTFMSGHHAVRQVVYWTTFGVMFVIGKECLYNPSVVLNELRKEKRR